MGLTHVQPGTKCVSCRVLFNLWLLVGNNKLFNGQIFYAFWRRYLMVCFLVCTSRKSNEIGDMLQPQCCPPGVREHGHLLASPLYDHLDINNILEMCPLL